MTAVTDSPVDLLQFDSESEDYDSPTRAEAALVMLGVAVIAFPAGLLGLAIVPFVLGARALRNLAKG
jgi:hypothetical protein